MRRGLGLETLVVVGALSAACGDDTGGGGQGGSGGADVTTTATSASAGNTTTGSGPTSTSGTGQSGTGQSSTGQGGSGPCTTLTPSDFALAFSDGAFASYASLASPNLGVARDDSLSLELKGPPLDGGTPGTYDLSQTVDSDYATCARCFLLIVDPASGTPRYFFQSQGTFELATGSTPLDGNIEATITDLTLVEVSVDPATFSTTPVPGGDCLELGSFAINLGLPGSWTCDPQYYDNQDGCDCGCGIVDPDCPDALAASCEYCDSLSCANDGSDFGCDTPFLDPMNSAACISVPSTWDCDPALYDSGLPNECDCGCGEVDPDCPGATAASCNTCNAAGSCAESAADCASAPIDPTNNAECSGPPGWTCEAQWYDQGNGECDCGCGIIDPDCQDATAASCDYCNDSGSCAETSMDCASAPIDPNDNSQCVGWTCDPGWYDQGNGECDCGCGILDPDCPDALPSSCNYCEQGASCANDGTQWGCDQSLMVPTDNAVCI